jgi:hypothetical protein
MDFGNRRIDFQEADHRYAGLQRQRDAGTIDDEEFDAGVKQLMVLDDQARWWAKSRSTGEWHYYDGSAWIEDTPPVYQLRQQSASGQLRPFLSEKPSQEKDSLLSQRERSEVQDKDGGRQRRRAPIWAMRTVFLAVLVLGGVGWYVWHNYSTTHPVPDVVGKTPREAMEELADTKWDLYLGNVEASSVPKGTIARQYPDPGDRSGDWTIGLYISGGLGKVEVPDIVGLRRSEAENALVDAGLASSDFPSEIDPSGEPRPILNPHQKIVRTDPSAGTEVRTGTSIEVYPEE